jgi:flagellar biosynthesis protein FlhF
MPALSTSAASATLIAFPGAATGNANAIIAAALKAHRVPEFLAAQLLRGAGGFADPETALVDTLADALAARMHLEPLDLDKARGILLIGADDADKTLAAAAIAASAAPRETITLSGRDAFARLRGGALPSGRLAPGPLVVMETEDFHPLNPRARGAFAALSDIEMMEPVGVVSGAGDAEDVAEMVAAFRFKRIIVTGLDRTRRLGTLIAAAACGAHLAHVVRDGRLETPDFRGLAAALLAFSAHA